MNDAYFNSVDSPGQTCHFTAGLDKLAGDGFPYPRTSSSHDGHFALQLAHVIEMPAPV